MDKKNEQTKGIKQINKKARKMKEKIMNKADSMVKNAQTKDLEMDQKSTPIIEPETTEKPVENTIPAETKVIDDVGTSELVSVLKIPMQDAKIETESPDVHSAIFDGDDNDDDVDDDVETENLNDRYFDDDKTDQKSDDDFDNDFFEDEKLMAEMGVEIIDLGMQTLAMGIAQDFDNPEKYAVSDYKKNKIKKPLELLLRKRGAKVSPEVMFGVVLLVVYAPTMISAIQERKEKANQKAQARKNAQNDVAEQIPDHIQSVDHEQIMRDQDVNAQKPITPIIIPKKKGRPKGSKDNKKRSSKGYKGNSNAS
jgi:hypothetical protein